VLKIKSLSCGLSFLSCLLLSFLSQERKERSKKRYPPHGKWNKRKSLRWEAVRKKNPTLEREKKESLKSVAIERKQFRVLGRIPEIKSRVHQRRCVRDQTGSCFFILKKKHDQSASPTL
jgi:hypothetical protein